MRFLSNIFLLLSLATAGFAQSGKISGLVTDERTREPLVGVNILMDGTKLGATSDVDGRYVILKVPPGSYSLSASLLGYARVMKREVEVFIDRTTTVDFRLTESSVELQEVSVVAERRKVVKDQTSSEYDYAEKQITAVATEGLRGVLELTSGFLRDPQGNFTVRGSGAYDVNFQINGVSQVNSSTSSPGSFGSSKADNSYKYDVNPLAVQSLQLIAGGFTAEYGNAQAGVVKVVTKEGTPQLKGELRVEVRPSGQYHFGNYLYDQSHLEWQRWGSVENWFARRAEIISQLGIDQRYSQLARDTAAAAQALYNSIIDREIRWAHSVWLNNHTPSDDNPLGVYDYRDRMYTRYLWGIGGPLGRDADALRFYFSGEYRRNPTRLPTPEKTQVFQYYLLNVTYQPIPNHKIKFSGSYQKYRGGIWSGSEDIRWSGIAFTPPGVSSKYYVLIDPVRNEQTVAQTATWLYSISDHSYLEATLAHQQEKYELPYEYLTGTATERDRLDSLNDPRGQILKDGIWWDSQYFRPLFNFSTNYYQDNRTESWNANVDYSNQIGRSHLVKVGVRAAYWDMLNNGVNSSFLANTYVTRSGFAEYYRAYPWNVAAFVQDKMEFAGMIVNVGVRAEAYNFNEEVAADPFNPFYQGEGGAGNRGKPETAMSRTQSVVMPRLGMSFPIGENTAFRIQYGHFASMPIFSHGLSQRTESGWIGRGNPNLKPKKTINYEFGVQQMLSDDVRLDVALYYNDRNDQIDLSRYASYSGSRNRPAGFDRQNNPLYFYTTFANRGYGSTRGIETRLEKTSREGWSYRISYSLSQSFEGRFGAQDIYEDGRTTSNRAAANEYVASSDRTHNLRALLQYYVGENEGRFFGLDLFSQMTVSLTYSAQSGIPFTYTPAFEDVTSGIVNNRRYPLESSFDLNIIREFTLAGFRVNAGMRVMNLFNNKWLTPMDVADDVTSWIENGITVADPGNDPLRLSYVVADYRAYRNIPRQIFFSLGVGF
ncbi:MAG: TonB-dependent receptor [Ignavibacteriae bacterium]|nr:TonB-dependent receptor [Ignavibacteriota bacterium]